MIVAVVQELLDTVFLWNSKFYEIRVDSRVRLLFKTVVADGDTATVFGDVRYQDEELKHIYIYKAGLKKGSQVARILQAS